MTLAVLHDVRAATLAFWNAETVVATIGAVHGVAETSISQVVCLAA
jgi:hypothetical protein